MRRKSMMKSVTCRASAENMRCLFAGQVVFATRQVGRLFTNGIEIGDCSGTSQRAGLSKQQRRLSAILPASIGGGLWLPRELDWLMKN